MIQSLRRFSGAGFMTSVTPYSYISVSDEMSRAVVPYGSFS